MHQLELLERPPDARSAGNPWPLWPNIFRVLSAHEEGGERLFAVSTQRFAGEDGRVRALHGVNVEAVRENGRGEMRPPANSEFTLHADLVLLAMGFLGPERGGLLEPPTMLVRLIPPRRRGVKPAASVGRR